MSKRDVKPRDLNSGRPALVFAALSLVFFAVLASAPMRPYFSEWRRIQGQYNALARDAGLAEIPVGIQQIWKPRLGISDRCTTCHLGMSASGPVPGNPLFKAHPPIPHDPREYGCTVCHAGQGRATTKASAHGFVEHWDEQMLSGNHASAGCGTCHNRVPAILRGDLERGLHLLESLDCLSCHRVDGRGRGKAADLSLAGLKGYRRDWHAWHLAEQAKDKTGQWASSYGPIPADDLGRIEAALLSRIGAPRVVEAQALAFERGCLGCHKIGGRGGEEGPALDTAGRKPVGDLSFAAIPGDPTLVNYMRQHFIDPPGVVPGSLMPAQAATVEEADLLTSYVLFLRSRDLPAEFLPKDRIRSSLLGEKPAPLAGEQAFLGYCAGCHGSRGRGRNYGNLNLRFPAIGSPDFLDVASDAFIESTLKSGRTGRRMPPLAAAGGSIGAGELPGLVAYLRSLAPDAPSRAEVEKTTAEADTGERVWLADCASCHGRNGEGTELGSPLATADSRVRGNRDNAYRWTVEGVPGTAMPRYRAYSAAALRSLIDHMVRMPAGAGSRSAWKPGAGNAASGEALYLRVCAGCHGGKGEGKSGPALSNPGFQQAATAEFVAATIVRGRSPSPMPAFGRDSAGYPRLSPQDVLDLTAFIRTGFAGERKETNVKR